MKPVNWTAHAREYDLMAHHNPAYQESVRAHGLPATMRLYLRGQEIRRQNQAGARGQRRGTYWTHNLAEFRDPVEAAGIEVLSATDTLYRGYDDLIIGRKPEGK